MAVFNIHYDIFYHAGDGGARGAQGPRRGARGRGRGRREDSGSHRGGRGRYQWSKSGSRGGSRWSESGSRGGSRWNESSGAGGSQWSEGSGGWASLEGSGGSQWSEGTREWSSWDREDVGGRQWSPVEDSRAREEPEEEESDGSVDIISGRQFSQVQAAAVKQWAELEAYSAEKIENTPEQEFLRAARKLQVWPLLQKVSLLVPCAALERSVAYLAQPRGFSSVALCCL